MKDNPLALIVSRGVKCKGEKLLRNNEGGALDGVLV